MIRSTTCCFTGHRPNKLPWGYEEDHPACLSFLYRLHQATLSAYHKGYRHFIVGMALGCDTHMMDVLLQLRRNYPDITIEAAIPCQEQAKRWSDAQQHRHATLVDQCDYETMVQHHYSYGCMQRRDRYMVDRSSLIIAAYDGFSKGGTAYTLSYAIKEKLETLVVPLQV